MAVLKWSPEPIESPLCKGSVGRRLRRQMRFRANGSHVSGNRIWLQGLLPVRSPLYITFIDQICGRKDPSEISLLIKLFRVGLHMFPARLGVVFGYVLLILLG